MSSERYLVAKAATGLGNRILCVLNALLYGRLSDRKVVADWRDPMYSEGGANAFPLLFETEEIAAALPAGVGRSVAPAVWTGRLDSTYRDLLAETGLASKLLRGRYTSVDPARLDYPEEVAVYYSVYEQIGRMRRHFQGAHASLRRLSDEAILRDLLARLRPVAAVTERVAGFRARHWDDTVIGVHVRFTDRRGPLAATLRRVGRALESSSHAKVFVATDNADVLRQARQRYGARRVLAFEKWFPEPGMALHKAPERRERVEDARAALVDMYLLAASDWLIADLRSSFAYIARLLFAGPPARVSNLDPCGFLPRSVGLRWDAVRFVAGRLAKNAAGAGPKERIASNRPQ